MNGTSLSNKERTVLDHLAQGGQDMLVMLERLVNTDSPSRHKAGVDAVGDILLSFLEGAGLEGETVADALHGDAIVARVPGATGEPHCLLMGHRDTVFPVGEAARRPFRVQDGRAYGPGVADMKGGLVVGTFVAAAMARFSAASCPVAVLFTADEEIASPSSRHLIEREARGARAVFNCEPGRPNGDVVTARKGGIFLRFDIVGKAAHSGAAFGDGVSAIGEAAYKIVRLHALTDPDRGITANVGTIRGGQSLNTVSPDASGEMDMRYVKAADRDRVLADIEDIVHAQFVAGTRSELALLGEFLPLEKSPAGAALFGSYVAAATDLGLSAGAVFSGGCADSGFASATGAPTLCGVGPVGAGAHTEAEYIEVGSLVARAQTLALTIMRL